MTEKMSHLLRMKNELKDIFFAGLNSVKPHVLIRSKIKVSGRNLIVNNKNYPLDDNVYLVGFGKAVMAMAIEMEKLLGKRLAKGIISIPRGSINQQLQTMHNSSISQQPEIVDYRENCENNQADEDTLNTTQEIMNLAASLGEKDTLIVLISGGGSALLSMPHPSMTLDEKNKLWKKLQNGGAGIKQVNMVRQKLSMVKAGKLAELAHPATVLSFILSDIIGDPVELIAGGPTCYISRDMDEISSILEKYDLKNNGNEANKLLNSSETLDKNHFTKVNNFIIGNNSCAVDAARDEALKKGLNVIVLFNDVEGLVKNVSKMYVKLVTLFCQILDNSITKVEFANSVKNCEKLKALQGRVETFFSMLESNDANNNKGLILIAAGEPSVVVTGTGKGGRNQELALQFSLDWCQAVKTNVQLKKFDVMLLSAGTDGQDGPTDATGAFGHTAVANNDNIKDYLMNNDAYNFYTNFENGQDLLKTGLTGTNVMDLHLVYIKRQN